MTSTNDGTMDRARGAVRARRGEEGSALLVAVMMLVLMGFIGFAALDTVTRDRQVAGFQTRSRTAFYAAEAGLATAMNLVRAAGTRGDTPALPQTLLGDTAAYADYGGNRPSFRGDPTVPSPVAWSRDGGIAAGMNLNPEQTPLVNTLWRIRIEGQTPDGATSRVDAMASKVLDAGY